jgi:small subunit ribosomal protein S6
MYAREYEIIYVAKPDISDEEVAAIGERTQKVITDRGGHVLAVDEWGKKKLAYDVKKYSKGHFVYLLWLGEPEIVAEIERTLRIDDKILRFLTVKIEERVEIQQRLADEEQRRLVRASAKPADDDNDDDDDYGDDVGY